MDAREQRGLLIAATCDITRKGAVWLVPSQSGKGKYTVSPDATSPHCSCPDHTESGVKCKHLYAVDFAIKRQQNADGSTTVTRTVTVTETIPAERPTYRQDWPAYNAAQTEEKDRFLELLSDLCDGITDSTPPRKGQKPIPLRDAIFAAVYKVYSGFSGRRFASDLRAAVEKGFIRHAPHYNSIFNYFDDERTEGVLRSLIAEASLPLKAVELDFACDSSGFMTSRFERWFDHKYGVERTRSEWVKVHLMCGVKTHIVTAVEIRDKDASDTKLLPELVDATAKNFRLRDVLADRGYGSLSNYAAIDRHGATPYIAFKSIHSGKGGGLWEKMFHLFSFHRSEFAAHYHKRSNVESTFSMVKRKFGDSVRSKTDRAMKNEVLAKLVCHNVVCLIHETHELGIQPAFWSSPPTTT